MGQTSRVLHGVECVERQCRGGCLCAGPYGMTLLRLPVTQAALLEEHLTQNANDTLVGGVRVAACVK